jgi:K(+)-stimulated pyrophosphate-energized sodium pump
LYQAIFMANAGGAWDNAKKIVEVDLHAKGTALHDATIVGDTVGDPFKDTSSVALNPVIKFTTLFGLLAVELAVSLTKTNALLVHVLAVVFFLVSAYFVWRSFYMMRIPGNLEDSTKAGPNQDDDGLMLPSPDAIMSPMTVGEPVSVGEK